MNQEQDKKDIYFKYTSKSLIQIKKFVAIVLLATLCLSSCNQNSSNKTLTGKKFYTITADAQSARRVMANTPITFETITILEEEFYFSSDSILIVTPTVIYVNINKEVFQIYLKQIESVLSPRKYQYNYGNGSLDIYEVNTQTITIEEHDNFYSTSTGETFYKHSIVGLTTEEKRERITKIITVNDDDLETLLKSELVLSNTAVQDNISLSKEVEKNNNKSSLFEVKKIKEETDRIINENADIYVRLYEDPLLHKIENDIWPDDNLIQTAFYIAKDNYNQVLAFTEIPYSQTGDWFMSMTHYFNASGNTVSTERIINTFTDGGHLNLPSGLYKRCLVKYFDNAFNLIGQEYKLTDANDKVISDPAGENMDIIGEYEDYDNYTSLLNSKSMDFKSVKVFSKVSEHSSSQQNTNIFDDKNCNINGDKYNPTEVETNQLFKDVEINPEPPQGMRAFMEWIGKNLHNPQEAIEAKVNGQIQIGFVVERDGSLSDIEVIKDLGYGTAEAVLALLQKSEKWSPGIQNGRPVRVAYILPIRINYE